MPFPVQEFHDGPLREGEPPAEPVFKPGWSRARPKWPLIGEGKAQPTWDLIVIGAGILEAGIHILAV
jgi:hypothetical protein